MSLASGAFHNAGQGCCAIERVYVHRDVYESFVEAFVSEAAKLRAGDPADETTTLGPLVSREALRKGGDSRERCGSFGSECSLSRGSTRGGYFHPAVVVGGDALRGSQRARLMTGRAETFGPVAAVIPVHDDEEAIEAMNDTSYGHNRERVYIGRCRGRVHTRPPGRRHWVLERLQRSVGQLALDW